VDRAQDTTLLIARLLLAALFLPSGIEKLMMGFPAFTGQLASRGLPFPEAFAVLAIAIEVLAPIALILGVYPRTSAVALIAFVVMATAISHRFWEFVEPAARRGQEINFYKNLAIIAGLLFYYVSGPGAWSLRRMRFGAS
jgi:putative oxidoreductase